MRVRDAIRAQFYLPFVERSSSRIREVLQSVGSKTKAIDVIVDEFETTLSGDLDDILLPTIVSLVSSARSSGGLLGTSPEQLYRAAFLKGKHWTDKAKAIPQTYDLIFDQIASLASAMTDDVVRCVQSLVRAGSIKAQLHPRTLNHMTFTSGDRHAITGQHLLLSYQSGERYIYKHGDHRYFALVSRLADLIKVPGSLRLRFPQADLFDDFALIEYISASSPATSQDAKQLYQNFGALIAFMDLLNYCDGHFENIRIAGTYPVIIDLETVFHSFQPAAGVGEERSILYTGLIQTPPKEAVDEGISAPMQMPTGLVQELAKPIAINDRTDNISLRYRGLSRRFSDANSAPIGYKIEDYVPDVEFGFEACFKAFLVKRSELLAESSLWTSIASTRVRQVMRTTLYYLYLMRRNQMPDIACSLNSSNDWFLRGLASEPKLMTYETYELQRARVPIFFHSPGSRDLIDAYNGVYRDHLPTRSVDEVRTRWLELDSSYCERSLDLIQKNLSLPLSITGASATLLTELSKNVSDTQ